MTSIDLNQKFIEIFNTTKTPATFFAPGRINLIGEHTDYNGGHVFPASISFGTYALGQKRSDQKFRLYSMNFPQIGIIECDLSSLDYDETHNWANYPKGMLRYLKEAGFEFSNGADILFYGNIPNNAGLSSSASIEMATGVLIEGLYDLEIDRFKMIQIGQKVENDYIGVQSGLMDQFAIGMGRKDYAILLNCNTLEYEYAPLELKDHFILIIYTNKQRSLAGSKYNERRKQCDQSLSDLKSKLSINSLGDLTKKEFEQYKHLIQDKTNQKRAKHVVYENARTLEAFEKLKENDLEAFGKLMNESHKSLQQDYEVTGSELDTIVQAAWEQEGVLGARMTGAGFGGCAIAIVEKERIVDFKNNVNAIYHQSIGYDATFYTATIGDGAKEITEGALK
ncbi:galactokinase [Oceanobacillus damuensis]|uniref:galactokinase n=1 Tax=Oceanobacillus damuensis TaxID=937928 RepID=UPI000AEBCA37|nr:galactokinase [Oceanobacillus damuensis]